MVRDVYAPTVTVADPSRPNFDIRPEANFWNCRPGRSRACERLELN
jgi:hypothetical protein